MKKIFFFGALILALVPPASAWTPVPYGPPAVISAPDCPDGFTMDVHHRHEPAASGSVTRDGYPVLLKPNAERYYIMPQGMKIVDPVVVPGGCPMPDHVPAP